MCVLQVSLILFGQCSFESNIAESGAGGVGMVYVPAVPIFSDCRFTSNVAHLSGAALALHGVLGLVNSSVFLRNHVQKLSEGGAIQTSHGSTTRFDRCTFLQHYWPKGSAVLIHDSVCTKPDRESC